jgi:16S rRNA (cytosine967-C5)-methyltransferase
MRIIDLCSAPGGKTLGMAENLAGDGIVQAYDQNETRLRLVDEAAERCSLTGLIITHVSTVSAVDAEPADLVLLDAPCTGLGVVRRKPEIKWRRTPDDIQRLAHTQEEMIRHAATFVVPGGALIYSTCTVEPEENQRIVAAFLARNPTFRLEDARHYLPDEAVSAGVVSDDGFLETWPDLHGCDGAFAARLVRNG